MGVSESRARLAQLMEDRRAALNLRWEDVAAEAQVTTETLRVLRNTDTKMRPLTRAGIERALSWRQGSIAAVLAGGDPIEEPRSRDSEGTPSVRGDGKADAYVTGADGTTHVLELKDYRGNTDDVSVLQLVEYARRLADELERRIAADRPEPVEEPGRSGPGTGSGTDT